MHIINRLPFLGVLLFYPFIIVCVIRRVPEDEATFGIVIGLFFYLCYIVPMALFVADVRIVDEGVYVRQFTAKVIPFSAIRACYGVFWVPFQMAIIVTRRRLPLTILLSGDSLLEKRRSFLQPGELISELRRRIADDASKKTR